MNRNRHLAARLGAVLGCLVPGLVLAAPATSLATGALVPSAAVYSIGGPDTPLPMTFTTSGTASAIVVTAEGFVASVACPPAFVAVVSEGAGVITASGGGAIPASTEVACTVSLALGEGAPAAVSVVASERDEFNVELSSDTQLVALELIEVDTALGDVSLTGGTHQPAEPRSVGDELTRTVTFDIGAERSISFTVPDGTSMTGCTAQAASSATCTVSRTLSLADLALGSALVAPTLFVDGFPVSRPDADIDVPSERRIVVEASASADVVRVWESVTVTAIVTNIGSIELGELAIGGAGIGAATCDGQDPATITLDPGDAVTCTATHVATPDGVGAVTPVVVRAISPFGLDSDLVDDDPTSATDIDAASMFAPYSVVDADVAAAVSVGAVVAFVEEPGEQTIPMALTVSSVGSLSGVQVTLPLAPAPGLTLDGCDTVVDDDCRVTLGVIDAGVPASRALAVRIGPAALPADGVDTTSIDGVMTADGGLVVAVDAAVVRTAGLAAVAGPSVADASGDTAGYQIEITVAPGHPVDVTIVPDTTRSAVVTGCTDAEGTALTVAPSSDGSLLGTVPGASTLRCSLVQEVTAPDRVSGAMPVEVLVRGTAGSAAVDRWVRSDVPTVALVVVAGAVPTPPEQGYSVVGSPDRPNTVTYPFEVLAYGDLDVGDATSTDITIDGPDVYRCGPVLGTSPARVSCSGVHTIEASDVALGEYVAEFEASAGLASGTAGSMRIPTPGAVVDLLVTELSSPRQVAGYRTGETIRLLVQVRNRGSLPLTFGTLHIGGVRMDGGERSERAEVVGRCDAGAVIAAGETVDCDFGVTVAAGSAGDRITVDLAMQEGLTASFSVAVVIDAAPAAAPPPAAATPTPAGNLRATGNLATTGSDTYRLVATALLLVAVGSVLDAAARARRPRTLPLVVRRSCARPPGTVRSPVW